jgi:hypothetical protein
MTWEPDSSDHLTHVREASSKHARRMWQEWREMVARETAKGMCPYSGLTLRTCKRSDMCDCFEFNDLTPGITPSDTAGEEGP